MIGERRLRSLRRLEAIYNNDLVLIMLTGPKIQDTSRHGYSGDLDSPILEIGQLLTEYRMFFHTRSERLSKVTESIRVHSSLSHSINN
jgi:hypothetical protein